MTEPSNSQANGRRDDDPRQALVDRVAGSEPFAKSPRLRELFIYLAECAIRDPQSPLTEHQVGIAVFKRAEGYDTSSDTVVRVQASELRKRLKYYFLSEGLHEPLVVELPRGSYLPVFSERKPSEAIQTKEALLAGNEETQLQVIDSAVQDRFPLNDFTSLPRKRTRLTGKFVLASLLCIVTVLCGWLAYDNARMRRKSPEAKTPFLSHFWNQFFQEGRKTDIVPSDVGAAILADLLKRTVTLREYSGQEYPGSLVDSLVADPAIRPYLARPARSGAITPHDLPVLHSLSLISGRYLSPFEVISPANFQPYADSADNFIFLGHKRANPWVELVESRMNFRYVYEDASRKAMIVNQSPLPGEQPVYVVDRNRLSYGVVAYLPKAGGKGNVLLLFGLLLSTIDGAGHLVTDEAAMANLHSHLGIALEARVPYFEVLLAKKPKEQSYSIIANRIIKDSQ